MKAILLHNWKAKIASLLLAFAIWFLISLTIQDQLPPEIPVPGTGTLPPRESPPPVPGVSVSGAFPPACEEIVSMPHASLYRLHWFEAGDFAVSLVEFPARAVL